MSAYDFLAGFYDTFQQGLDPIAWADFVDRIVKKYNVLSGDGDKGRLLLCDLGCGTGAVSCAFSDLGYDVIGVDSSSAMLDQARSRCGKRKILWLCQDMAELDLFGTMDVFVSLLDTVNHITSKKDIEKLLRSFYCFLNPGGLFIFDLATKKHFEKTLGNEFFYSIEDDFTVLWENDFDEKKGLNTASLTMFASAGKELFERQDAEIVERYYSDEEIRALVEKCHLEVVGVYGDMKMRRPNENDERVFYIIRRPLI
ncbi:MAG: class I SAM-dependent methyltransferase [Clostridiales bacterium]|nr:class I SAM-dependent methyltransferase [Clostridiales bacterium]